MTDSRWLPFCLPFVLMGSSTLSPLDAADAKHVLVVVGPSNHAPGTHEVGAGGRLIADCLQHAENVDGIEAEVVTAWPSDAAVRDRTDTIVFIGDRFPGEELPHRDRIMTDLTKMMDRGCGIVCVHYATGLGAKHVPPDGEHPLLYWMGGYFATQCAHHQSIAKIFTATIEPGAAEHPICRGWKTFTLHDEPYIKNYFGKDGLAANVTPIATSLLPPEAPHREVVSWAVSRPDGGRGMGVVMPHFYQSWKNDDLRMLIMNGVVWTAKLDVPAEGVKTPATELDKYAPVALSPQVKN